MSGTKGQCTIQKFKTKIEMKLAQNPALTMTKLLDKHINQNEKILFHEHCVPNIWFLQILM